MEKLKIAALAGLALVLLPGSASAAAASIGTSASVVVTAKNTSGGYRVITLKNQSATATIGCTDDDTAPVIGAAGTFDIGPGMTIQWGMANTTYQGPIRCVASAAATPATVTAE